MKLRVQALLPDSSAKLMVDANLEPNGDATRQTREVDSEIFIRKAFDESPRKGCEMLFRIYYRSLCTHAVRYVYSREIAEDLVADVFYTFWNTKAYLSVNHSFRAFLFRSVRNRSYNYLMNEMKKTDPIESANEHEIAFADRPETIMQFEELSKKVDNLVSNLPPQCQKVFIMNRFEGKKCREIAEELHLSLRTVEVHVAKALAAIRHGLKDQWIGITILLTLSSLL